MNNPIILIDPNKMQASNPIIGLDGNLLGFDSDGWKGEIIIMEETIYNNETENGSKVIDHERAMSLAEEGFAAKTLTNYMKFHFTKGNNKKGYGHENFISNIFTSLVDEAHNQGLSPLNSKMLFGGKIAFDYIGEGLDKKHYGAMTMESGKYRIKYFIHEVESGKFSLKMATDGGNAKHIFSVHEFLHGKFKSNILHKEMYKFIKNHTIYSKSLNDLSNDMNKQLKEWKWY